MCASGLGLVNSSAHQPVSPSVGGVMRLHLFRGGIVRINKGVFTPGRGDGTTLDSPMPFYVLRHPKGTLLIDTGSHPDVMVDPVARWGGLARAFVPVMKPGEDVVGSLRRSEERRV